MKDFTSPMAEGQRLRLRSAWSGGTAYSRQSISNKVAQKDLFSPVRACKLNAVRLVSCA